MPFDNFNKKKPFGFFKRKFNKDTIKIPSLFSTNSNSSISSKNSRYSQNSKPRPLSQFFFPKDEDQVSTEECSELSATPTTSSRSSYSLRTPTASRSNSKNRMSAIVTHFGFDASKEEIRAMSMWRDKVTEISQPCLCSQSDCLYQFILDPNLFQERPIMEQQRFSKKPLPKDTAMRKFILNELIETEKTYNQLLNLIHTKYMQPMVEESLKGKYSLVKANYIPLLFNHLLELLQLSSHLLKEFKEKPDELGKVLQETEPKFSIFLKYTIHYKHNEKQIRKACNNILFIKINQENLARRDTNRLGMSDYFIAPIQRITRYCLLMKDLQKYSIPPDLELDKALKAMTALAIAMNNV